MPIHISSTASAAVNLATLGAPPLDTNPVDMEGSNSFQEVLDATHTQTTMNPETESDVKTLMEDTDLEEEIDTPNVGFLTLNTQIMEYLSKIKASAAQSTGLARLSSNPRIHEELAKQIRPLWTETPSSFAQGAVNISTSEDTLLSLKQNSHQLIDVQGEGEKEITATFSTQQPALQKMSAQGEQEIMATFSTQQPALQAIAAQGEKGIMATFSTQQPAPQKMSAQGEKGIMATFSTQQPALQGVVAQDEKGITATFSTQQPAPQEMAAQDEKGSTATFSTQQPAPQRIAGPKNERGNEKNATPLQENRPDSLNKNMIVTPSLLHGVRLSDQKTRTIEQPVQQAQQQNLNTFVAPEEMPSTEPSPLPVQFMAVTPKPIESHTQTGFQELDVLLNKLLPAKQRNKIEPSGQGVRSELTSKNGPDARGVSLMKGSLSAYAPNFGEELANQIGRTRLVTKAGQLDQLRINLEPRELGALNMRLKVDDQHRVHMFISTESEATKEILNKHMDQLKTELARQNLSFGDVNVEVDTGDRQQRQDWEMAQRQLATRRISNGLNMEDDSKQPSTRLAAVHSVRSGSGLSVIA
ncbi:MAG: flagellar hook-length control protein FliK [Magnetococcus sp. DMHC-6]